MRRILPAVTHKHIRLLVNILQNTLTYFPQTVYVFNQLASVTTVIQQANNSLFIVFVQSADWTPGKRESLLFPQLALIIKTVRVYLNSDQLDKQVQAPYTLK